MSQLQGTRLLTAFILRRDRVRILIWIAGVAALVALTAASTKGLYPDQRSLDEAAAVAEGNAAAVAFNGPAQGLDTLGGQVAFQVGATGLVVVGLMSLLMTGRLTRGEEEAGRLELIRALPVGSRAPTAAALTVLVAMNVLVGVLVTGSLVANDLPVTGSLAMGASFTLLGSFFAALALVAAQVTENTRVVYGIAGSLLGASFVLRAVGDIGNGTLSWLSPIGVAQKSRPYAGERWLPFLLLAVAGAGLVVAADVLARRRDVGGGLIAPRPGRAEAAGSLGHPLGLAVRLQRGSLIGWSVGVWLIGAAYGSIADSIDEFVGDNQALADAFATGAGVSLTDSYLATSVRFLALIGGGFALQSVLRLRGEETSMRAEPLLATSVSRVGWASSHLVVAVGGSLLLLAGAGVAVGLTYALVAGDLSVVAPLLATGLVYTPALWLLVGLAVAVVGLVPRATTAVWAALTWCFVVGVLGVLLDLPRWLTRLSPFEHVPQLPGAELDVLPLVVLCAIAAALTGAGLTGIQRRDIA
jgi:ABC-2 type transport system permease protein